MIPLQHVYHCRHSPIGHRHHRPPQYPMRHRPSLVIMEVVVVRLVLTQIEVVAVVAVMEIPNRMIMYSFIWVSSLR